MSGAQRSRSVPGVRKSLSEVAVEVQMALAWLQDHASRKVRDGMARYALPSTHALGVSVANIQVLAKQLGRRHALAVALWKTGGFEARMLCAFIDEPERVTPAQMDRWCRDFDSWGICDTLCLHLFDRTPHAWAKIAQWSQRKEEFVKRAAFALLAGLAGHDKGGDDRLYLESLALIEAAATDERNFVKKAVNWALRRIGGRSVALNAAATKLARRLADSAQATPRWIGKNALAELARPAALKRLAAASARNSSASARSTRNN